MRDSPVYHDSGRPRSTTGRLAEAEPLYVRAIDIIEKALPGDHPNFAITLDNYARLLDALDRHEEVAVQRARA